MRQSLLFTKTRKDAPKDEVSKNADLLIRSGMIFKEMSGVYSFLPLGLRVLNKIINIIRSEMNEIGGQELFLSSLQEKNKWDISGRWDDAVVDNWFKTKLKNDSEVGLAFTHEEPITNIMREYVRSFRDLPFSAYQFQTKFRNETRAKSGIMRCKEFIMKDLYSFSKDETEHNAFYERAKQSYINIFDTVGIGEQTYLTFASGGTFSKYSHEFQTLTESGEDEIFVHEQKKIAINKEVLNEEVLDLLKISKDELVSKKAVEVGNIFTLGTKYSESLNLKYDDENGESKNVFMGSYGIGPARIMGTVAELLSDDKGLVWPESIAPYDVHIIQIGSVSEEVNNVALDLEKKGLEVLIDDRDIRPGEKFADSDLIGIPSRIIVSEKNVKEKILEVKNRKTGVVEFIKNERI